MASASRSNTRAASTSTHPQYALYEPQWRKLADCYDGTGGFLDGTYLVAHPREWDDYTATTPKKPSKKLKARRALARYENVAQTILDQLKAALFRGSVSRVIGKDDDSTEKHPLSKWWKNVDGWGCAIDDYMALSWIPCGLMGHVVHLMDMPETSEQPLTKADAGQPYLRTYTALDLADWITDDAGVLMSVKLLEVEPRVDITKPATTEILRVRYVTDTDWELVSSQGTRASGAKHAFGRLPVVVQYAKRRALSTVIGQSVLHDPMLYIDLYNLTSELRELLRNQTFSILNVVLGTGQDAIPMEKAIEMIKAAGGVGTENVLFSGGASQFVSADASNVEAYQKERESLLRTIYRLAGVPWEADSKDAEASGSLKLKREDMNQVLADYADECEKAEYRFVELWFRQEYPDTWEKELERAEVVIRYPDTFDVTPFAELLEQAQAALALELPPAAMKEIRKRVIDKFLPDASPAVRDAIDKELDAQAKQAPIDAQAEFKAKLQKLAGSGAPFGGAAAA